MTSPKPWAKNGAAQPRFADVVWGLADSAPQAAPRRPRGSPAGPCGGRSSTSRLSVFKQAWFRSQPGFLPTSHLLPFLLPARTRSCSPGEKKTSLLAVKLHTFRLVPEITLKTAGFVDTSGSLEVYEWLAQMALYKEIR